MRAILHEIVRVRVEMRRMAGAFRAGIAFALSPVLGEHLVLVALTACRERRPKVGRRIVEACPHGTRAAVAEGALDFAFMAPPGAETVAKLTVARWCEVRNAVIARRGRLLQRRAGLDQPPAQQSGLSNRSASGRYALPARLCAAAGWGGRC